MFKELSSIIKDLTPDDLPGKLRAVAIRCGINDALSLLFHVPGLEIYVPTTGRDIYIHNYIKHNYNGLNTLSIAVKLGINSTKVKDIANKKVAPSDPLNASRMRLVVSECGKEVANNLLREFPGERIQVPSDLYAIKRRYIKKYFNGSNGPEICIKLKVTDRFVRKVVSEIYKEKRNLQLNLFSQLK